MSTENTAQDLTIDQAAKVINVSRATMDRLLGEGQIDYYRAGANKRITQQALDKYRGLNG